MQYTHHISYAPPTGELCAMLEKYGVKYDKRERFVVFDVLEKAPYYEALRSELETVTDTKCIGDLISALYSEKERLAAPWLQISSSYAPIEPTQENQIAQAGSANRKCAYTTSSGKTIYRHYLDKVPYIIEKGAAWRKNRVFCTSIVSGYRDLFCNDDAREKMESAGLRGAAYCTVYRKTGEPFPDIWRLVLKPQPDFIVPICGIQVNRCEVCGCNLYEAVEEKWSYHIDTHVIDSKLDFIQSPPVIGYREYTSVQLISQRAYRFLKENKMNRALTFLPLQCI